MQCVECENQNKQMLTLCSVCGKVICGHCTLKHNNTHHFSPNVNNLGETQTTPSEISNAAPKFSKRQEEVIQELYVEWSNLSRKIANLKEDVILLKLELTKIKEVKK